MIVLDFESFGVEELVVGNIERDLLTFLIIETESPVFSFNSSTHFLGRDRTYVDPPTSCSFRTSLSFSTSDNDYNVYHIIKALVLHFYICLYSSILNYEI